MNKRYCIFDMDGTLVDSTKYWHSLERDYLTGKGVSQDRIDGILKITQPMTTLESAALFIKEFGFEGTPKSIAGEVNAMIELHYRTDVCLKPGVREYLEALKAKGTRMCIASATAKPLVTICMERLDIAKYFEFILSCEEVGSGKDKPDVFLEAVRRLGGTPEEAAVFEDSLVAATSAKAAGFFTVGIYDEYAHHNWPAMVQVADLPVTDWRNLPEMHCD